MKVSIIFHSESGNTKNVAEAMVNAAQKVEGIEAKAMSIDYVDKDFVIESTTIIFGCPTYCGTLSWQMKKFLDMTALDYKGKLGGVFVTENYLGGGADIAELAIIGCLLVGGMLVYSGGAADGAPLTHYGAVLRKAGDEFERERACVLAQRIAKKAIELF